MSVAMLHADLRAGLRKALQGTPGLPASVSWQGLKFTPVVGEPFLREVVRPISSRPRAIGRGGTIEHKVLAVYTLVYPAGAADVVLSIERAAGSLLASFPPGFSVYYGDNSAFVLIAESKPLMQDNDWLQCPVEITLMAHTAN